MAKKFRLDLQILTGTKSKNNYLRNDSLNFSWNCIQHLFKQPLVTSKEIHFVDNHNKSTALFYCLSCYHNFWMIHTTFGLRNLHVHRTL